MPFGAGGPAGAYRRRLAKGEKAIASLQRKYRSRKPKLLIRKPLNKVEKKQVTRIAKTEIKRNGELRYCPQLIWDADLPTDEPTHFNQANRVPVPIPSTGQGNSAYCLGFETGMTLGTETSALNASMPPDVGTQDCITPIYMYNLPAFNDGASVGRDPGTMRNGEYMYAHSQRLRLQISMLQARDVTGVYLPANYPASFRVLVVKRRPGRVIAGDAGVDFRTEMFRNYDNNVTGLLNSKTLYQLDKWAINKQALIKLKDIRFKLSPPVSAVAGSGGQTNNNSTRNSNNSYPQHKDLDLWLPKPNHKIKWNGSADADPRDSFNYKVQVFVIAYYPNGGNIMGGNTGSGLPAIAECKFWNCKVYTESKFREP